MKKVLILGIVATALFYGCALPADEPAPIVKEKIIYTVPADNVLRYAHHLILDVDSDSIGDVNLAVELQSVANNTIVNMLYKASTAQNGQLVFNEKAGAFAFGKTERVDSQPASPLSWQHGAPVLLQRSLSQGVSDVTGAFAGPNSHYLGFRLKKNNDWFYGWIELQHNTIAGQDQLTVVKTAFNTAANKPLTVE